VSRIERLPPCPDHLNPPAAAEWRRVAKALQRAGVLTIFDRAALAAYCQAYGRWVEAEERLRETPVLFKTPAGYVQQSPWLGIANKQLELMGRYMVELGMTPASRTRVATAAPLHSHQTIDMKPASELSDAELKSETARLLARRLLGEQRLIEEARLPSLDSVPPQ
jgi:P27 family predicted phage terminase small subunit